MIILGIETSCDETAGAVLKKDKNRIQILSNVVASSAALQAKYGGVIPEQAAREQIKSIIPVIEEALRQAFPNKRLPRRYAPRNDGAGIDAIAVTYGPGLIGSLLVGVETAKVLAKVWGKPLIPVNHLIGHFYANWIARGDNEKGLPARSRSERSRARMHDGISSWQDPEQPPKFPCLGLLVSGGHTDLVLFTDHGKYKYLGGTRDDATGECFDKCARLLGLPYPGGPEIAKLAQKGNPKAFDLPRPMIDSVDLDFSFSGLKTSVSGLVDQLTSELGKRKSNPLTHQLTGSLLSDLSASIEQAIVDVLVNKTIKAAKMHNVKNIMIAGGVAANKNLVQSLQSSVFSLQSNIKLFIPPPNLCTDNGAMIAAAGFFQKPINNPLNVQANPNLSLLTLTLHFKT